MLILGAPDDNLRPSASPVTETNAHSPAPVNFPLPYDLPYGPPDLTIIVTVDDARNSRKEYHVHKVVVTKWIYFEALLKKGYREQDADILKLYIPVPVSVASNSSGMAGFEAMECMSKICSVTRHHVAPIHAMRFHINHTNMHHVHHVIYNVKGASR